MTPSPRFKESDKVVCVISIPPTTPESGAIFSSYPVLGHVYDVRGVRMHPIMSSFVSGLYLTGIEANDFTDGKEWAFNADAFRLLSEVQAENRAKWERLEKGPNTVMPWSPPPDPDTEDEDWKRTDDSR